MRMFRLAAGVLVLGLATACADLAAVRDFARLSASTSDYPQIVEQYVAFPARVQRFVPQQDRAPFVLAAEIRATQRDGLLAMQDALTAYLVTLGGLAADDLVVVQTDAIRDQLIKFKLVDEAAANAGSGLIDAVGTAATRYWQQRAVREMITTGHAHLPLLIEKLKAFVSEFAARDAPREAGMIRSWTSDRLDGSRDPAGRQALREWAVQFTRDADSSRVAHETYAKALDAIAAGHLKLYEQRDNLSLDATIAALREAEKELRPLAKQLRVAFGR